MTEVMNYDPNLNYCGRTTKQSVRLTFALWQHRKTMEVEVGGNVTGLSVMDSAVEVAFNEIWTDTEQMASLVLEDADGNLLETCDDEDEGEEWLKEMLISAEILSIRPDAELCGSPKRSVGESERTPGYAAGGKGELE